MYLEDHKIAPETLISKTDDSFILEFTLSEECDFFDGHFPEIHLLPAVGQIDLMMHFAKKYLGDKGFAVSAKRIKFGAPIFPGYTVRLNVKYNSEKKSLAYKLTTCDESKSFSSGNFALGE
ncbi:MAG: hydroxymyristoyl-ACP dehydratase [Treponema sp.]|nr:hydroxymyristoyl-ACP dehydratase [Treponema sp.]